MLSRIKRAVWFRLRGSSDNGQHLTQCLTSSITFIGLIELTCGAGAQSCRVFDDHGRLVSYDSSHLTQAGAEYIDERLAKHPTYKALLLAKPQVRLVSAYMGNREYS